MFVINVNGTYSVTNNVNDVLGMMLTGKQASIMPTKSIKPLLTKMTHIGNGMHVQKQEN